MLCLNISGAIIRETCNASPVLDPIKSAIKKGD